LLRENLRLTPTAPLEPYLRGAPPGLPFRFDDETVRQGLNFRLTTLAGDLDLERIAELEALRQESGQP
jgi:hypothetical protein